MLVMCSSPFDLDYIQVKWETFEINMKKGQQATMMKRPIAGTKGSNLCLMNKFLVLGPDLQTFLSRLSS